MADFSSETVETIKHDIFKMLREKKMSAKYSISRKTSLQNKGELFSEKQRLREFPAARRSYKKYQRKFFRLKENDSRC